MDRPRVAVPPRPRNSQMAVERTLSADRVGHSIPVTGPPHEAPLGNRQMFT